MQPPATPAQNAERVVDAGAASDAAPRAEPASCSPPRHREFRIRGVTVKFPPLQPYPPQYALMERLILAAKRRQHALVESPTGTGKSLALLCGSLAWQESQSAEETRDAIESDAHDDASPTQRAASCSPAEGDGADGAVEQREAPADRRDDTDDDDFVDVPRWVPPPPPPPLWSLSRRRPGHEASAEDCIAPKPPSRTSTIFYCTRTHSQLSHIASELRRTPYGATTRMTLLASRNHYCVHPEVSRAPSHRQGELCAHACRLGRDDSPARRTADSAARSRSPLRWRGAHHSPERRVRPCHRNDARRVRRLAMHMRAVRAPFDIEELVQRGAAGEACPYYASQGMLNGMRSGYGAGMLVEPAQLVLCPYTYVLDPVVRRHMGISLDDAVVILDEAHNIEDASRAAASCELTREQVAKTRDGLQEVLRALGLYDPQQSWPYGGLLLQWRQMMDRVVQWMDAQRRHLERDAFEQEVAVYEGGGLLHELEDCILRDGGERDASAIEYAKGLFGALEACVSALRETLSDDDGSDDEGNGGGGGASRDATRAAGQERIPRGLGFLNQMALQHCSAVAHLFERFIAVLGLLAGADEASEKPLRAGDYRLALTKRRNQPEQPPPAAASDAAPPDSPWSYRLHLWCLNPAVAFAHLRERSRSILLTSGTLAPLESFAGELGVEFALSAECQHVINAQRQVWAGVIGMAAPQFGGLPLKGDFKSSESWAYQDAIGEAIAQCCAVVPGGVLCFLPSYRVLRSLLARWRATEMMARVSAGKRVFIEPSSRGDAVAHDLGLAAEKEKAAAEEEEEEEGEEAMDWSASAADGVHGVHGDKRDVLCDRGNGHTSADHDAMHDVDDAAAVSVLDYDNYDEFRAAVRRHDDERAHAQHAPRFSSSFRREPPRRTVTATDVAAVAAADERRVHQRSAFDRMLQQYYRAASARNTPGAILFAVCRGKVSEGVNFADDHARAVLFVGMPYPSTADPLVRLKRQYNDARHRRQAPPSPSPRSLSSSAPAVVISGHQWYTLQTYRAINQAIGRCIRHRHDYGAIVLLDARFAWRGMLDKVSKWLRQVVRTQHAWHARGLACAVNELRAFFECAEAGRARDDGDEDVDDHGDGGDGDGGGNEDEHRDHGDGGRGFRRAA